MFEMERRVFLKAVGVAACGLFLPRWVKPSWKQTPTRVFVPYDFELALFNAKGHEITGAGYERIRGVWEDFSPDYKYGRMVANRTFQFPVTKGSWGEVDGMQLYKKTNRGSDIPIPDTYTRFPYTMKIKEPNITLQLPPENFSIHF